MDNIHLTIFCNQKFAKFSNITEIPISYDILLAGSVYLLSGFQQNLIKEW